MELNVLNIKGEDTGKKVTLNDSIFAIEPNDHAIAIDVKQYLANQRQGTSKSKERSELTGSTRKLGRQKGGGGARRGDINSPLLRGGARAFGPRPQNWSFKLNKKFKQLARKSALTYKAINNEIIVLDGITFEGTKTKEMVTLVNNLKIADKKVLIILDNADKNVYLSARNLPKVKVLTVSELATYRLLDCSAMVVTEATLNGINQHFKA